MPAPAIAAAGIAAGASLLGQGVNALSQGSMNRKTRKWNEKMYAQQRADALADWNMMNEYNSPQMQMKRLKDAGLNPRLMYEGAPGNSGSVVRSTDMEGWRPTAPQFDLSGVGNFVGTYYDIKTKEAQLDNLKTQNTVATQDALLRAAQVVATNAGTAKTAADTDSAKFNLQLAQKLQDTTLETAAENLRKLKADTDYVLDNNERQAAMTAQSLLKGAEEVLNLRMSRSISVAQRSQIEAQIDNLHKDSELKRLDIELKRLGIQPGDAMFMRMLGRIVGDPKELNNKIKEYGERAAKPLIRGIEWLKKKNFLDFRE